MSWSLVDIFYPGETARSEDLDRQNRELNQRQLDAGMRTPEWIAVQEEAFAKTGSASYNGEILTAAGEGAVDGLKALPGRVRGVLDGVAGWSLAWVPWWGWLIGAGVVFWWLGGASMLRGILARK